MTVEGDVLPACHQQLRHGSFKPAAEFDLRTRGPCRYCFPEGGPIEVGIEHLVVGTREAEKIHRDVDTGPIEWEPRSESAPSLANKLRRMDPDEVGGGA